MRARGSIAAALATAGLLLAALGGQGARLVGVAVLLGVGFWFVELARARGWSKRAPTWLWEWLGPTLIVGLATALYGRLLLGDFPVNHDHPIMLLRAWITGSELLPSGRLAGVSGAMFGGYPANTLYPMGTDLLVCALRGLTGGLASWETAYAWAVYLAVLAYPLGLYALGRRLGGPLAGALAGLAGLIDRGAWFQGGWDFNLSWGVWSMGLSFSMCLWSLWSCERLARHAGRPWLWLGAATSTAYAVVCHPMAIAILGTGLPLLFLVMLLEGQLGAPGRWLARVSGALALAALLCAFWVLPFIAHQDWYEPLASSYRPFADVLRGLLSGNLLVAMAPALAIGGLVGLLLGALRSAPTALFWLLWTGLLLFFSSDSSLLAFDLLERLPSLGQLQFERFMYAARAALLLGAGALVAALVSGLAARGSAAGGWRAHGLRALAALALAPLVALAPQAAPLPWFAPARPLDWASETPWVQDLRAAADHLQRLRAGPEPPARVAVLAAKDDHSLALLPVLTGLPIFKVGFTPENNYRHKFSSRDPAVWRAVGVTHALSLGPQPGPDLEELGRHGRLVLYRFRGAPAPRAALSGPGQALVERDEPEDVEVRLTGTGPGSRLTLHLPRYALWRAELDGEPLEIEGASVGDSPPVYMSLPARDGLLRLRYRNGAAEWLGRALTVLGLLACGLLVALGLRPALGRRLALRLGAWVERARRATTLAALALLGLAALALTLRLLLPAPSPFPGQAIVTRVADLLPTARAELLRPGRAEPCQPFDGQRLRCPGPEWNFSGEVLFSADQTIRRCVWLHPVEGARHSLTFEGVRLGDHLRGFCGLDDRVLLPGDRHDVELTLSIDGQELGRVTCPARRGWHAWSFPTPGAMGREARVTFASQASFNGRRHFCFTAYTTREEP